MASLKKSHLGADEMRVTTGQATQAMITPLTVSLEYVAELEVLIAIGGGEHGLAHGDQGGIDGQRSSQGDHRGQDDAARGRLTVRRREINLDEIQ
jgi:hypothetical protein